MADEREIPGKSLSGHDEEVRAEQVRQIYALAPIGMVATVINSLVVYFVLREAMPNRGLIAWLAAMAAVTAIRLGLMLRFRRMDSRPEAARTWGYLFIAGMAASGLAWGSLGALPLAAVPILHQVFIAFVLGGMAAGAAATYSALRGAYLAFSIPALAPLALHFFLVGDIVNYAMGAMLAFFGLLLWRLSEHNYRINRTSLQLGFENRRMIARLQSAKEHVEGLNRALVAQIEGKMKAEAELREHRDQLERTVEERTADLVRANEQLTAAKNAAEAASWAKSEFLANMSHEIRTPLAGAMGMINLVLEMNLGEEERQMLEMAKRSTDSLLRLISDLLDFSRLEAGILQFDRKPFPLARAIDTAIEVVSITAREKGLRLGVKIDDSVPQTLEGDEGRLRQVLVNLLGNAVKFTRKDGEVEVAVCPFQEPEAPGREYLLFAVRDSGIGIPPDQIENIFGKFVQVDSSSTRRYGGTGLGLPLSRQIVEKMGGRIWAESRLGEGSTFYFTYPQG